MFILIRRSDRAYEVFMKALVESRQDHLAKCLDPAIAEKCIEERDQEEREKPRPAPAEVESSVNIQWQPVACSFDEMDTVWYDKLFNTGEHLHFNLTLFFPVFLICN